MLVAILGGDNQRSLGRQLLRWNDSLCTRGCSAQGSPTWDLQNWKFYCSALELRLPSEAGELKREWEPCSRTGPELMISKLILTCPCWLAAHIDITVGQTVGMTVAAYGVEIKNSWLNECTFHLLNQRHWCWSWVKKWKSGGWHASTAA